MQMSIVMDAKHECAMNLTGELKWHLGANSFARLKFSESREAFSIDMMFVPPDHRGKGVGEKLLKHIVTLADMNAKPINLTARPIGGQLNDAALTRLVKFYQRFDFEEIDKGVTVSYMRRAPKQPERT
jgi:GNAT superfamily N-acetyltransferase